MNCSIIRLGGSICRPALLAALFGALIVAALPTAQAESFEAVPPSPLPIPDGTGQVLQSSIEVPDSGTVSNVEVSIRIGHTFVGDLGIALVAPDGTEILLLDRPGLESSDFGDSSNLSPTFAVTFSEDASVAADTAGQGCTSSEVIGADCPGDLVPTGDLTEFDGIDGQGTWRLIVTDEEEDLAGTFDGWTLSLDFTTNISAGGAGVIQFQQAVHFSDITGVPGDVVDIPIVVERIGGSAGTVSVDFATADGAATPGLDYQPVSMRLTWADGDASSKLVRVPFFRADVTGVRNVNLILSRPTGGAVLGAFGAGVLYVKDGFFVFQSSDLSVTLAVDGGPVVTGQPFEYRMRVVNHGPFSLASDVVLGFLVPPEVDVLSSAGADCAVDGQLLSCALGTMDIGQAQSLRVSAQVRDDGSTMVRRIAPVAEVQITGNDLDFNTSNNIGVLTHDALPPVNGTGFQVGPGISGSWYDSSHDGEGFLIEILPGGQALAYWFSYDASGNQAWMFGAGTVKGNTLTIPDVFTTRGGVFGPAFDPDAVQLGRWGVLRFVFSSCTSGVMGYRGPPGFGNGVLKLERLSYIAGSDCTGGSSEGSGPLKAATSGSYYDLQRSGEGFLVEVLGATAALVYWFTYDFDGNQAWIAAPARIVGESIVVEQSFITNGPAFGPNFDPKAVNLQQWGTLRFTFDGCTGGRMTYDSVLGFGRSGMNLTRLSSLAGHPCVE